MSTNLKPYPQYTESPLRWLAAIPAHWKLIRAKYLFKEIDERSSTGNEELLSVSHITGVTPRSQKNITMFMAESYVGHKLCRAGDLVVNTMWAWMGALGVAKEEGIVSPSYAVYRPITSLHYAAFLDDLLRTKTYVSEYVCRSTGIRSSRLRLYPDMFLRIPVATPPRDEQARMMSFLAAKDRSIARFIRAKHRVTDLLNARKQAIILEAVTNGVNSLSTKKHSCISWIGEIPKHWELRKLKHLSHFRNGVAFKPGDWEDSGTPIIRIQNLNGATEFNYTSRTDLPKDLLIQPGDLLFAWSGNRGTSFGSFLWDRPFPGYLNQHIFKVSGYPLNKRFFYYLLRAVTAHVEQQTHGIIGLVHITKPELGSIAVPVPPPTEQEEIAVHIDKTCEDINRAIDRTRREITLIREYRARLIVDVVTGKLDVRGAEVPEIGAQEEPELLESIEDLETLEDTVLAAEENDDAGD